LRYLLFRPCARAENKNVRQLGGRAATSRRE
jgi:hypothetical protein